MEGIRTGITFKEKIREVFQSLQGFSGYPRSVKFLPELIKSPSQGGSGKSLGQAEFHVITGIMKTAGKVDSCFSAVGGVTGSPPVEDIIHSGVGTAFVGVKKPNGFFHNFPVIIS